MNRICDESVEVLISVLQQLRVLLIHDQQSLTELESIGIVVEFELNVDMLESIDSLEFVLRFQSDRPNLELDFRIVQNVDKMICAIRRDVRFPEAKQNIDHLKTNKRQRKTSKSEDLLEHDVATSIKQLFRFSEILLNTSRVTEQMTVCCYVCQSALFILLKIFLPDPLTIDELFAIVFRAFFVLLEEIVDHRVKRTVSNLEIAVANDRMTFDDCSLFLRESLKRKENQMKIDRSHRENFTRKSLSPAAIRFGSRNLFKSIEHVD